MADEALRDVILDLRTENKALRERVKALEGVRDEDISLEIERVIQARTDVVDVTGLTDAILAALPTVASLKQELNSVRAELRFEGTMRNAATEKLRLMEDDAHRDAERIAEWQGHAEKACSQRDRMREAAVKAADRAIDDFVERYASAQAAPSPDDLRDYLASILDAIRAALSQERTDG